MYQNRPGSLASSQRLKPCLERGFAPIPLALYYAAQSAGKLLRTSSSSHGLPRQHTTLHLFRQPWKSRSLLSPTGKFLCTSSSNRVAQPESCFAPLPAQPESCFAPLPTWTSMTTARPSSPNLPESCFAPLPVQLESCFARLPTAMDFHASPQRPVTSR